MAKAVPAKKAGSTALTPWTEKFAKYAKDTKAQVANIGGGGIGVSFGHGSISVGGTPVKGGKLECVIVGSCALNKFYKKPYDSEDKQPPDCYAFALIADDPDTVPYAQASDKQSEKCVDCVQNQFGTARVGRGKACANTLRLGCLTAEDTEDAAGIATAELATGNVSPTNRRYYSEYVDLLMEEHGRPPWAVVTEIQSHHDDKTQIRLEFRMVSLIDDDKVLEALEKRFLKVQEVLQRPFAAPVERAASKAGANKKFAGTPKKTARK